MLELVLQSKIEKVRQQNNKLILYMFDLFTKEKNQVIVHFFPKTTATFFGYSEWKLDR